MFLWRISNHVSLTGDGALRASGRWHTRGRRVVYCAEHPAAALLEILVHFEIDIHDLPARYRLLKIEAPDDIDIEVVRSEELPQNWVTSPETTRAIGNAWLRNRSAAMLRVPSAIVPETYSVLLNPAHPQAHRVAVVLAQDQTIDPRLLK